MVDVISKGTVRDALEDDALLILTGVDPIEWQKIRRYLWKRLEL